MKFTYILDYICLKNGGYFVIIEVLTMKLTYKVLMFSQKCTTIALLKSCVE